VFSSSSYSGLYERWFAFDSSSTSFWASGNAYTAGEYTDTNNIICADPSETICGEYIFLSLPITNKNRIARYTISVRSDTDTQTPTKWCLLGYNIDWIMLDDKRSNSITNDDWIDNGRELTFVVHNNTTHYLAYCLIATQVNGGASFALRVLKFHCIVICYDSQNLKSNQ